MPPLYPPAYWQRKKIRELWSCKSLQEIARTVNISKTTLMRWRDAGMLGALPERNIQRSKPVQKPRLVLKLTRAPLTAEPLIQTGDCDLCKYALVCKAWLDDWRWMGCEQATEHEVKLAEKDGVLGKVYYVK
jgi:hypothetical protein